MLNICPFVQKAGCDRVDALSEVFRTVHLEQTTCRQVELSAPWGLQGSEGTEAVLWVVLQGSCWLKVEGINTPLPLVGGDLILLPHGQPYTLHDQLPQPHRDPERISDAARPVAATDFDALLHAHPNQTGSIVHLGQGGLSTTLLYGCLRFEPLSQNPILSALPPLIVVKDENGPVDGLEATLQLMSAEMTGDRPGSQTVINHLAGILFVQAVRAYIANQGCTSRCWLRALMHPQIGRALSLIHRHPETDWTIEALAKQVNLSRTTFFVEFRNLVGEPPSRYLTRWRMHRASQFLRDRQISLSEVADRVGYESEAAFSKAFKRWMGRSPGAYRQALRQSKDAIAV